MVSSGSGQALVTFCRADLASAEDAAAVVCSDKVRLVASSGIAMSRPMLLLLICPKSCTCKL